MGNKLLLFNNTNSYSIKVTGFNGPGSSAKDTNVEVTGVKNVYITQISEGQQATSEKRPILFDLRNSVKSFIGRDNELKDIHNELQNKSGRVVVSQVTTISGLGGIGKSELARKYAYDYRKFYDENIIWINAETQESIKNSFHRLATGKLKIPITLKREGNEQERDTRSIVCDIYKYFQDGKSLFIFDNAEEFRSICQFLPSYFNLHIDDNKPYVLITSRNRKWVIEEVGEIKVIELGVLPPETAAQFIRKALEDIINNLQETEVNQLAEKLQYFPLALRQATSYIKERRKSNLRDRNEFKISDYLEVYEKKSGTLLNFKLIYIDDRYAKTTLITWRVTLENIEQKMHGKEALDVLNIMAYLAPDKVEIKELFSKLIEDEDTLWGAVELLHQYSMIDVKIGVSSIHRLVQLVIRIWLHQQSEEEKTLTKALEMINCGSETGKNYVHVMAIWDYACKYENIIDQYFRHAKYGQGEQTLMHLLAKNNCYKTIESILTYLENKFKKKINYQISPEEFFVILNANDKYGSTPIHRAAESGHIDVVKYLVEKGADFKAPNKQGSTPLHIAAESGHTDVVKYFVEKGADFKSPDNDGLTPIHRAAESGHIDVVKYLVEKGADFKAPNKKGSTPLHIAARSGYLNLLEYITKERVYFKKLEGFHLIDLHIADESGHLDVVKYLVEKGADFKAPNKQGSTPLHIAARSGRLDVVKYFVEKGADFKSPDNDGLTPLHEASLSGHIDLVKYLVEKGADFKAPNKQGSTPLHIAARSGRLDVAKYFVEKGADFKSPDNDGLTPLHEASLSGHIDLVKYLVEKGADFKAPNKQGSTPLHIAARSGRLDLVKYFVEKGADFKSPDNDGLTPLHEASLSGHIDLVKYLVEKGADFKAPNKQGSTPLHIAARSGRLDLVKYLVEKGADFKSHNKYGSTPLHRASLSGYIDVVKYLVEKGADFKSPDNDGLTPLHEAARSGHIDLVKYLVEKGADFKAPNKQGSTPLHEASLSGRLDVVKYFVEKGANFKSHENNRSTRLYRLCQLQ